jgi:serine/threonine-protein kinase
MTVLAREIEATYEVLSKMGEGGMGAVYKVRHRFFDEIRVIKVMQAELQPVEELKERFLGEAQRGKQLRHPNLAEVLDFSIASDGTAYIVMEYIEGINLRDLLKRTGGPLDYRTVIPIAEQTLDALGFMHAKRFVHRDISPDNLMLTKDGGAERVKLIDLGIAKSLESTRNLTMAGKFVGKLQYASPEHFGGEVDARSDIYSLGLVLYELLTNARPITGEDHFSIIRGHVTLPPRSFDETDPRHLVPTAVRNAVLKALAKKPEDRYQSAAEFAEALRATLGPREERTLVEETIVTKPAQVVPRAEPEITPATVLTADRTIADSVTEGRKQRWYVAAVVALLVVTGAVVLLPWPKKEPPSPAVPSETATPGATVTVEAPVVVTGQLLINALPWGTVASVVDAAGVERLAGGPAETPLLLSLPPGTYKVRLTNPNSNRTVTLDATVAANGMSQVRTDLDRVDVAAYIEGLGIGR